LDNELFHKLARLQGLMHRRHMSGMHGPAADATRGQGRILALLRLHDGVSTKDLSYLLGVSVSSLNELLAKLEKNGYVTREPSEEDKRIMLVKLTEKGRDEKVPGGDPDDILSALTDEERRTFSELLDKLIAALSESLGAKEEAPDRHERRERDDWARRERLRAIYDRFGGRFGRPGDFPPPPPFPPAPPEPGQNGGPGQRGSDRHGSGPHGFGSHFGF